MFLIYPSILCFSALSISGDNGSGKENQQPGQTEPSYSSNISDSDSEDEEIKYRDDYDPSKWLKLIVAGKKKKEIKFFI